MSELTVLAEFLDRTSRRYPDGEGDRYAEAATAMRDADARIAELEAPRPCHGCGEDLMCMNGPQESLH